MDEIWAPVISAGVVAAGSVLAIWISAKRAEDSERRTRKSEVARLRHAAGRESLRDFVTGLATTFIQVGRMESIVGQDRLEDRDEAAAAKCLEQIMDSHVMLSVALAGMPPTLFAAAEKLYSDLTEWAVGVSRALNGESDPAQLAKLAAQGTSLMLERNIFMRNASNWSDARLTEAD